MGTGSRPLFEAHPQGGVMTITVDTATEPRSFHIEVPRERIDDLRRRIAATRWPSRELVGDRSQGVQLATLQELARYWTSEYDWRRCEARLNALPQFTTEIDGVEIHFVHVRSRHENALPLIMTHGWPGSVLELLDTVGPLTDPTAHDGTPEDAFHLVLPSLPGYGLLRPAHRARLGPRPRRARLDPADGPPRPSPRRRPGRRPRRRGHGRDGPPSTRGTARDPRQPADRGDRSSRPPVGLPAGTRRRSSGPDVHDGGLRLLPGTVHPAADDRLLDAGLTRRAGGLAARPRYGQLLQDLPGVRRRRACGQPHPRQHPRQHQIGRA